MIRIDESKCTRCGMCLKTCPFNAIFTSASGGIGIDSSCKMCRLCVRACPQNAIIWTEAVAEEVDKSLYSGVMVYVEHCNGEIHPVTYELIGKARQLAAVCNDKVHCICIGDDIEAFGAMLLEYGVDKVFLYQHPELRHFRVDNYTAVFENCIRAISPSVVLIGATATGRSLAPRVATRFKTGLTADCTVLERRKNTDLVQIRPAFGGNIMAQILTTRTRPQFATVRYKVMDIAPKVDRPAGECVFCDIAPDLLESKMQVLDIQRRPAEISITDADTLVVVGKGMKDIGQAEELAGLLGAQLACTRPMVEEGRMHYTRQIGLSGRTVKPKFIITLGVSGAVQFVAGMNTSDYIVAINNDANAPIFQAAHLGLVGDLDQIVPRLMARIKMEKGETR